MKNVLKSKTVWFNVLTVLIAIATFFGYTPNQELAEKTTSLLLVLSPAVNLLLRLITSQGLYLFRKY